RSGTQLRPSRRRTTYATQRRQADVLGTGSQTRPARSGLQRNLSRTGLRPGVNGSDNRLRLRPYSPRHSLPDADGGGVSSNLAELPRWSDYGTERMRQKLLVLGFSVLVNTSAPNEPAGLVICGIQSGGARLKERSSA